MVPFYGPFGILLDQHFCHCFECSLKLASVWGIYLKFKFQPRKLSVSLHLQTVNFQNDLRFPYYSHQRTHLVPKVRANVIFAYLAQAWASSLITNAQNVHATPLSRPLPNMVCNVPFCLFLFDKSRSISYQINHSACWNGYCTNCVLSIVRTFIVPDSQSDTPPCS